MRQVAKIGLHLRSAERVGHGAIRQNACCCAIGELLARALTFGVQKAAASGRYSLEEAVELV